MMEPIMIPTKNSGTQSSRWNGPISRENLSDHAYFAVKDALMQGRLKPGEKLLLRPMTREFGISATPIRDALLRLVSKDALTLDARGTAVVPHLTKDELTEIHAVRSLLEGHAAAMAALNASDAEIDGLEAIHTRLIRAQVACDFLDAVNLNTDFHLELCRIAHMPITMDFVENLWMRCGPILSHLYDEGLPFKSRHPHAIVVEALRNSQPDAARKAIQEDIRKGGKVLYKALNG